MKRKPIMHGDSDHIPGYRFVIITMDNHVAGPAARVSARLTEQFPGLNVSIHAAAEWGENPEALEEAKLAVKHGDIIVSNLLFIDEHITAILPSLEARRDHCDAMIGVISAKEIVQLTRMGDLDMMKPSSGAMKLMKLRGLPKILKFIPGKAQDPRAWFLTMQYWLGGSDDNVEQMIRFLIGSYAHDAAFKGAKAEAPTDYPEVGLYHPDLPGHSFTTDDRIDALVSLTGFSLVGGSA